MNQIFKLFKMLDKKAIIQGIFLVFLMIIGSIFEASSISLVTLFIGAVSDSINGVANSNIPWLSKVYKYSGITNQRTFLSAMGFLMLIFFVIKNLYLVCQVYLQNKFVYKQQARISNKLLDSYLHSPYTFHLQRNTAELLRNITTSIDAIFGNGFNPIINILSESFIIITVSILLLLVEPVVTLSALFIIGSLIFLFLLIFKKKLGFFGHKVQQLSKEIIMWTNQSIQGIKEIKVAGRESYFSKEFSKHRFSNARFLTLAATVQRVPRLYLEVIIIGGILLMMSIILQRGNEANSFITIMALFAMASIRLLPSLNLIANALNSLKFGKAAIDDIYNDVIGLKNYHPKNDNFKSELEKIENKVLFQKNIHLKNLKFRYPDTEKFVINDMDIDIKRGQSIAFVGSSGAGKTTLIDIILGLLTPDNGKILVDGTDIHSGSLILHNWQKNVGYIPQTIYLIDDTVRRNIAFGVEDELIDDETIMDVVRQSHLTEFVKELPEGLDTKIGERGVRISGGQRQRLGIARALYHDPQILVMDEATSSLDNKTEADISMAINEMSGKKTIIIIAHRLTTVKNCDSIFFLKDGKVIDQGKLDELLARNAEFREMAKHSEDERDN